MQTSYNGWTASANPADFGGITKLVIDGRSFAPGVRSGDVHWLFTDFFTWYDAEIEDLSLGSPAADEWGWAFRQNRNANNISCHGSATAADANATKHPNGKRGTMPPGAAAKIRERHKVRYRGLVRWGGDFTGTPDEMHHEIIGTPAQVAKLVADLKGQPYTGAPANLPPPMKGAQPWIMLPAVRSRPVSFQSFFNACPFVPALLPVIRPTANNFGPKSEKALKQIQGFTGTVRGKRYTALVQDGIDGPLTKRKLYDLGWRG